jgi:hypothetical protein
MQPIAVSSRFLVINRIALAIQQEKDDQNQNDQADWNVHRSTPKLNDAHGIPD